MHAKQPAIKAIILAAGWDILFLLDTQEANSITSRIPHHCRTIIPGEYRTLGRPPQRGIVDSALRHTALVTLEAAQQIHFIVAYWPNTCHNEPWEELSTLLRLIKAPRAVFCLGDFNFRNGSLHDGTVDSEGRLALHLVDLGLEGILQGDYTRVEGVRNSVGELSLQLSCAVSPTLDRAHPTRRNQPLGNRQ